MKIRFIWEYDIRRWGLGICAGLDGLTGCQEFVIGLGPFVFGIEWN